MNREECEAKILDKCREIRELYRQYNPTGTYLSMTIVDDSIRFWNEYYNKDADKPINFWANDNGEEVDE